MCRSVSVIGQSAFRKSGLRSVVVPTSVIFIDQVIMIAREKINY